MKKQLLTFGAIIITTLTILTLTGADFKGTSERFLAQLVSSLSKEKSTDMDPYDQRESTEKLIQEAKDGKNPVKETSNKKVTIKDPYDDRTSSVKTSALKDAGQRQVNPKIVKIEQETIPPHQPKEDQKTVIESDYRVTPLTSEETREVLEKVEVLVCFEDYIKPGASDNNPDEVRRWQEFLNTYMKSTLDVSGVYNEATQNAVKDFQQRHYDFVIAPWVPPLQPRTTGYIYKTTRSMANYIIGCPESEIFLEDPGIWYSHLEQEIML